MLRTLSNLNRAKLARIAIHRSAGFSLLEVLVGLLILAIGLLGLAGMQMISLRQNNDAYLRSQATLQAYDILDRMRASSEHVSIYAIDYEQSPDGKPAGTPRDDLTAWKQSLSAIFPGPGDGAIELTNSTVVTVKIQWKESKSDDADWVEFITQSEM